LFDSALLPLSTPAAAVVYLFFQSFLLLSL